MKQATEDRNLALDPNQSFIVQAPAGSGKTELLIQRYLKLLTHVDKAPEEIIAITFTRKAAGEMRARLLLALQEAKDPKPDAPHKKITWELAQAALQRDQALNWQLLQTPQRMRILTIDALAQSLCSQIPLTSGFGSNPSPTDDPSDCYQRAIDELIAEIDTPGATQQALSRLLLHLDNRLPQVNQLLINMLNRRDQWLPYLLPDDQAAFKEQLERALSHIVMDALKNLEQALPKHLIEQMIPLAQFAANQLAHTTPDHSIVACSQLTPQTPFDLIHKALWLGLSNLLLTNDKGWRKGLNKNIGFPPSSAANGVEEKTLYQTQKKNMSALLETLAPNTALLQAFTALQEAPPLHYEHKQWQIMEALLTLLPRLVAHLQIVFQQSNEVDFIELSLGALRALGTDGQPTELSLYLDYRIKHILVDEFQDTSHTHFRLLEQLIREWQPGDGRSVFLVGDPMQSIYRFRHADVTLFIRVMKQGIANISCETLLLSYNFRSNKNIIDWVNQQFTRICPPSTQAYAIHYSPAIASNTDHQEQSIHYYPQIIRHDDTESDPTQEGKQIVSIIESLQKTAPNDSIAILVRARSHLEYILPLLKTHNIAVNATNIELLHNQTCIMDLCTLTYALNHHADRIHWLALLRAPWCGLELADLLCIAQADNYSTLYDTIVHYDELSALSLPAKQRLQQLTPILLQAVNQVGQQPFAQWIEHTWHMLGGPDLLDSNEAYQYADQFFQLLESIDSHNGYINPNQLKEKLARAYPDLVNNTQRPIQIMTIHKAKGLEFDHIILPRLDAQPPVSKAPLLRWLERPVIKGTSELIMAPIRSSDESSQSLQDGHNRWLKKMDNQQQKEEIARLLYVATTRAKSSLHLLAKLKYNDADAQLTPPNAGSLAAFIWPELKRAGKKTLALSQAASITDPSSSLRQTQSSLTRFTLAYLNQRPTHFTPPNIMQQTPYQAIDLTQEITRQTGIIIHECLQHLSTLPSTQWDRANIMAKKPDWMWQLQQFSGNNTVLLKQELQKIEHTIDQILSDPQAQWILNPDHSEAQSEYPLSAIINDQAIHIILDRTLVDEQGIRWIIDYKTTEIPRIAPYIAQLEQYAQIMYLLNPQPIMLGIYFPGCQVFEKWAYSAEKQSNKHHKKESLT